MKILIQDLGSAFGVKIQGQYSGSGFRVKIQGRNSVSELRVRIQGQDSGPGFRVRIQGQDLGSGFRVGLRARVYVCNLRIQNKHYYFYYLNIFFSQPIDQSFFFSQGFCCSQSSLIHCTKVVSWRKTKQFIISKSFQTFLLQYQICVSVVIMPNDFFYPIKL